jgi:peptidyl-prolyl cis-trans isomerase D
MIRLLRQLSHTWVAKILFVVLAGSFSVWGIGDVVRQVGRDTALARVGGQKIEAPELQEAFRRNLQQARRMFGDADPTPQQRRMVALQTVEQVVTRVALTQTARRLGVTVPEPALQKAVWSLPAFQNRDGKYDPAMAAAALRNNNMGEGQFRAMMRDDLEQQQVLGAVSAGAAAPDAMVREVFAFQRETRVADAVTLPFAAAAAPAAPTEAQLQRWWANHPDRFSSPEYRTIKAIVLTPETVAKDVTVTDEDLNAAWDQHKDEFETPERRSAQVIETQDEALAKQLATQWVEGADWPTMQAAAAKVGGSAVELPDATQSEFPTADLADTVFATAEGGVAQPVHTALGWQVVRVEKITPGGAQTFEAAHDALRKLVLSEKANDLLYDRANRLENLLAGGSPLDQLPGDVGAAAVTGTLDAQGKTPAGEPAPIPGTDALRQALVAAAFEAKEGEAPKLTQAPADPGGAQSFYAVTVDSVTPPAPRPFEQVAMTVRVDWTADAKRHEQEEAAARLLTAVKAGQSLPDAARAAGLTATRLPPTGRDDAAAGVPKELVQPLFQLKPGEPTMIETADAFVAAALVEIRTPDPKADPVGYGEVKEMLGRGVGSDLAELYATGVRERANPQVTQQAVDSLAQASGGE